MRWLRRAGLILLIVFLGIQFIRPGRNRSDNPAVGDIVSLYKMPGNMKAVFENSCYDCHSNNTRYPWYVNIQPVGWMLARHVKQGKEELNFSEFGSYSTRRQRSKLQQVINSIKDGTMPLTSYLLMHQDAKLTEAEKAMMINWATAVKDSIK
jgi:hypothetical protein